MTSLTPCTLFSVFPVSPILVSSQGLMEWLFSVPEIFDRWRVNVYYINLPESSNTLFSLWFQTSGFLLSTRTF